MRLAVLATCVSGVRGFSTSSKHRNRAVSKERLEGAKPKDRRSKRASVVIRPGALRSENVWSGHVGTHTEAVFLESSGMPVGRTTARPVIA